MVMMFKEQNKLSNHNATVRGALLLDKILPGWYKEVDLENLNMQSSQLCMMGQLFGTHVESRLAKEMYPTEFEDAKRKASVSYGYGDFIPGYVLGTFAHGGFVASITPPEMGAELKALETVCSGHLDTRCDWSEEVAKRLAADDAKPTQAGPHKLLEKSNGTTD